MANKRISELTSITGANLADADLLVVVDVSDTTMASSGTNKKITMAELAKDSALTDNLVAKTTLTTDGDVLTRAAGAPARITRADLAQDSAFSSRYVSQADDIRIELQAFSTWNASTGAVSRASLTPDGGWIALAFPKTTPTAQGIDCQLSAVYIPTTWTTFKINLIYGIWVSSSDNAVFRAVISSFPADGGNQSGGSVGADTTVSLSGKTTARYYTADLGTFNRGTAFGPTGYGTIKVARRAAEAADTASVTVYGLALVLSKVS